MPIGASLMFVYSYNWSYSPHSISDSASCIRRKLIDGNGFVELHANIENRGFLRSVVFSRFATR